MKCCDKQNINRMTDDNAICIACGEHWHKGVQYTRREWDALLQADFERERNETRQRNFDAERRQIERDIAVSAEYRNAVDLQFPDEMARAA